MWWLGAVSNHRPLNFALLISHSLSAIFRGAVIHGMTKKKLGGPFEVSVKSRIARQSYGVVCQEPWDEEQHNPEDKWFDSILLKDVSVRVMKWHVVSVSITKTSIGIVYLLMDV